MRLTVRCTIIYRHWYSAQQPVMPACMLIVLLLIGASVKARWFCAPVMMQELVRLLIALLTMVLHLAVKRVTFGIVHTGCARACAAG